MADLKTSIRVEADDRFSGPAKKIAAVGGKLGKQFEQTQGELAKLGQRAAKIDQLGKLAAAIGKTGSEMRRARERTAALGRQIAQASEPTKKLRAEFERARRISDRLGEQHREQRGRLRTLRDELRGAGVDTRKLGDTQRKLAADIERATGRIERQTRSAERIGQVRERAEKAGRFAVGASLAGGEISRVGASMRRFASVPLEAAAEVGRQRGRLATLSMSRAGIDEVERVGRRLSRQYAGIGTAGFVGAAYDVRSAMGALSDVDVARVTGIAAELGRAADATTEEMTSAVSGAYGVFKQPLFADLGDVEFVEKFTAQLSQAVESFRTTGGRMEEGVKSMGAGLSLGGIAMSEQLAALGKLQAAMPASDAGTALRAMRDSSVTAQQAFAESGRDIRLIDQATGKLRPIASVLDDMERVFGKDLDAREAAEIKEAFGREEAVRVYESLWGSGAELRAAAGELEAATMADVRRRARARDENIGGALDRMSQRWDEFLSRSGKGLEPWLEKIESGFDGLLTAADWFESRWPGITSLVVGGIGAIGLVAAPLSGIVIAGGAAAWALQQFRLWILQVRAAAGGDIGPGMFGGPGGKGAAGRRLTDRVKGLPATVKGLGARGIAGRALGLFKGKAGLLGAGLAALSIGSTLAGEGSAGDKAARVSGDVGAIGGGLAGAKLGALVGTAVFPGLGTAIGGLLGSIAGGLTGAYAGGKLGETFRGAPEPALAGAPGSAGILPAASGGPIDNSLRVDQLTINQQPGEDAGALAEKVLREIEQRRQVSRRGALYDEL